MSEYSKEKPPAKKGESKLHATFSLMDFRAGHWPQTKTPPWLLNEMFEMKNPHWRKSVEQMTWQEGDELLIGSGVIDTGTETHEVDIYAHRDPRRGKNYFAFAAYPKGKSLGDFWNEDGTEKNTREE